ncbi:MAG: type IV conjugative transfer system lipoprotein TraV [Nitrospinae bacterium]|nr:type IV conjugative transfer system lipoprotein TraV [Nitrospinota bacterium]
MRTNIHPSSTGRFHLPAMLLTVMFLAGCAGGSHVGESWQCPIAQGTACASVSEADPAVAATAEARETTLPFPVRSIEITGTPFLSGILAWFVEFFRLDEEDDMGVATAEPLIVIAAAEDALSRPYESLRTKERVARIWIAPYVDAKGIYREGNWVRAVIRPAGWRLP